MRLKNYLNEFKFTQGSHKLGAKSGYDKSMAKALVILNRKGYKTIASHSGIRADHKAKYADISSAGYILFHLEDLTVEQRDDLQKQGSKKPFEFELSTGVQGTIRIGLWGKIKNDPYSEDKSLADIKAAWIKFANALN